MTLVANHLMSIKIIRTIWLALFGLAFLVSCTQQTAPQPILLQGKTMGTTFNIKYFPAAEPIDSDVLLEKVNQELIQINQLMSTYIPDSELSLLNKSKANVEYVLSTDNQILLNESLRISQISDGAFDVTVGPLVNLWGFGPEYRPEKVPSESVVSETRARVGLDKLSLNGNELVKGVPDLYIDLSTIAKGYGVDKVAELVEQNGFQNYLVEIGGEMRLKGFKHTGELWHIAVEKPVSNERSVHQFVVPKDNAVATSGNYRNYFEADGVRYSHIIDPDTAKPINHRLVSVTVIHPSSMTADGLSTAMMVMGEEKAIEFAEKHDIAAYIIFKSEKGFVEQSTKSFMQYLK